MDETELLKAQLAHWAMNLAVIVADINDEIARVEARCDGRRGHGADGDGSAQAVSGPLVERGNGDSR